MFHVFSKMYPRAGKILFPAKYLRQNNFLQNMLILSKKRGTLEHSFIINDLTWNNAWNIWNKRPVYGTIRNPTESNGTIRHRCRSVPTPNSSAQYARGLRRLSHQFPPVTHCARAKKYPRRSGGCGAGESGLWQHRPDGLKYFPIVGVPLQRDYSLAHLFAQRDE
jgi:hypothetical protein